MPGNKISCSRPFAAELRELAAGSVGSAFFNEPLAQHSSWQIGGPVDLLVEPHNPQQVATLVRFAYQHKIPLVVIGQGTNLLFDDAGVRGIVMKIGAQMAAIQIDGRQIIAQGGAWVPQLARQSMRAGLTGLEHCIGIPGTVGGLVIMNGGSQRKGISENIKQVWIVSAAGEPQVVSRDDCQFAYRQSALQGTGAVVVKVELECLVGDIGVIRSAMVCDLRNRRQKFPRKLPNCGSVFLSSAEMHASVGPPGKIIEEAGLKGARIGQAEVSRQHANFIVNLGGATSADVLALIALIRQQVRERINFELNCEVRYVRPDGQLLPAHIQAELTCTH
jgi:UDP-N-acetylmuramate dehydrogenase